MNKKSVLDHLRVMWGSVISKIYKNNIGYLVLPLVYIIIMFMVLPNPSVQTVKYSYINLDSYKTINLTNEEKVKEILVQYNLTNEQFKTLAAIVLSEAANNYDDAYAVINTIYNRTHSKNWVRSVNSYFGKGKGNNMYYQAISPRQFTVYSSGSYKRHLNKTNSVGYQAIIDFLWTENIMHNYLSFRSHSIKVKNSESFCSNGNNYFGVIKEENRI